MVMEETNPINESLNTISVEAVDIDGDWKANPLKLYDVGFGSGIHPGKLIVPCT